MIVRTVAAALIGAWVFERLRIPAGALIGAMVAVAGVNLAGAQAWPLPEWARFGSYAALGWMLGQGFTRETVAALKEAIVPVLIIVGTLLAATAIITVALHAMGLDVATAFLASSPGGISQMGAIALELDANAPLVVTAHLTRVIAVVVIAPLIAKYVLT